MATTAARGAMEEESFKEEEEFPEGDGGGVIGGGSSINEFGSRSKKGFNQIVVKGED